MNDIDKIKLEIYESSLDIDTKYELIDIVSESSDNDVIEEVCTILEASKKDADKLEEIGRRNITLRKGADITNEQINNRRPIFMRKDDPLYGVPKKNTPFHKSDMSKLDRKHKIRSSSRSQNGVIPEYGANPKYSKDISEKSKKKYENSFRNKKYDLDKSLESISNDTKKRILKDRLSKGKDIPNSMDIKMIKNDYMSPIKNDRNYKYYFNKTFDSENDPTLEKLYDLYKIMKKENDYEKYKKAHNEFTRLIGCKKTDSIKAVHFQGNKVDFYIIPDGKIDISKNNDKYYHGSGNGNIKSLTPSFKGADGTFYPNPRIYFNKNNYGDRMISNPSSTKDPQYNPVDKIKKSKVDNEMGGAARYIETDRELPVKRVK